MRGPRFVCDAGYRLLCPVCRAWSWSEVGNGIDLSNDPWRRTAGPLATPCTLLSPLHPILPHLHLLLSPSALPHLHPPYSMWNMVRIRNPKTRSSGVGCAYPATLRHAPTGGYFMRAAVSGHHVWDRPREWVRKFLLLINMN